MVGCYRFTVTSLQIHGHLLQKYGAVHRDPLLLLQIYGPGLWGGSEALICYRFMVLAQVGLFCYRNMVLPVLLQIYGARLKVSFCYRFMVVKGVYHRDYISCMVKHFRDKLHTCS